MIFNQKRVIGKHRKITSKHKKETKQWLEARKASEKVNELERSVSFYRYDENGRKVGLVFDEQN